MSPPTTGFKRVDTLLPTMTQTRVQESTSRRFIGGKGKKAVMGISQPMTHGFLVAEVEEWGEEELKDIKWCLRSSTPELPGKP